MPTNYRRARQGVCLATSALCLIIAPRLAAQAAEAPPPADSSAGEEIIVLSPFVVDASEDAGYSARATLAGSRVRTELKDVGSAITVVTSKFLQDTNSKNSADLLVYTTGTEVAGQGGNFTGTGDGAKIDSTTYKSPVSNTRVRGLAAADNLRDFFLTDIPWDSYNVGRVDLQRGPNSILFGIGSPAGIINSSLNAAAFKNYNKVEVQVASFGSNRVTADFNKVLLKDQLALRVSALNDNTKYKQDPAFRKDQRVYGALRFDPAVLAKGSAHTSLRANFEKGKIRGNEPRLTPPFDAITPWFTGMGKATYNFKGITQYTDQNNPALYRPWLGAAGNRVFDGAVVTFPQANSSVPGFGFSPNVLGWPPEGTLLYPDGNGGGSSGYRGVTLWDAYAVNTKQPGYTISPFKAKSLTDASIFDFYNHLLEGPNKHNWDDFTAYNLNASQTFFDNKLAFELAYDRQQSEWGNQNYMSSDAGTVTVDIMSTLLDGSANPNVGRAMVVGGGGNAGTDTTDRTRESIRGTVYGQLDFRDILEKESTAAKILGHQDFTYSQTQLTNQSNGRSWKNFWIGDGFAQRAASSVGQASRDVTTSIYLSDSLAGAAAATGAHLAPVTARMVPLSTTVVNWDTIAGSPKRYDLPVVNGNDSIYTEATRPYSNALKTKEVIDSSTFVWQGYFFGGNLVPMLGWRRDTAQAYNAGPPAKDRGIVTNYNDPEWRLPVDQSEDGTGKLGERTYNMVSGQTHTWSIVGHVPASLMKHVPGGLGLSAFYNQSQNFQPDASRIDIIGNHVPSPSGKTKDYGVTITALNEKIMFKINRYETAVSDATISTEMEGAWAVGALEAWGQAAAYHIKQDDGLWPGGDNYGVTTGGKILRMQPISSPGPYTQPQIDAGYVVQQAAVTDWFAHQLPQSMQLAWGMTDYAVGGGSWSNPLIAVTGDTLSKGTEFELVAAPMPGLDVSFNAAKTDAKRLNIAKTYSDWVEKRHTELQGPMGDIREWGGGYVEPGGGGSIRGDFNSIVYSNFKLQQALNNSAVPELRPWRFNATANYSFREGKLKGTNAGGSYRWQDKQVIGFPLNSTLDGYDVSKAWYGEKDSAVDFWIGYERKLPHSIKWRVQLNVRNAFASKTLIPITVQPDGSPGAYRIPEPRVISLSNAFEF